MNTWLIVKIVTAAIIFGPLAIWGIIKIPKIFGKIKMPKMPKIKFSIGKKIWLFLLIMAFLNFIYPGDWFVGKWIGWYFLSDYKKNTLKVSDKLKEQEIAPHKKTLKGLAKNKAPTKEDLKEAREAEKQIEMIEKKYASKGKGKTTIPQRKDEWSYVFGWVATDKQMEATNRKQKPFGESSAKIINLTESDLNFVYKTISGKTVSVRLQKSPASLDKNNYYKGWIQNIDNGKSDPIWLIKKSPDEFNGWIGDGFKTTAYIKKRVSSH